MYLKNNYEHPLVVAISDGVNERRIVFDCERRYTDTGNFISSGVTEISDEDFKFLMEHNGLFRMKFNAGVISVTKEPSFVSVDDLRAENIELKEKVEESKSLKEALAEKEKEISSLKEKLEAKAKRK